MSNRAVFAGQPRFINTGDIFTKCRIVHKDHMHYYLIRESNPETYYDIVMPLEGLTRVYNVGDVIDCRVKCINIAHDGRPGAFVVPN